MGNTINLKLTLYGKARLMNGTAPVPLRRKALALLYYLALKGPATRDQIADLLWGHSLAANNLRVELSYLRQFLQRKGLRGLPSGRDPLELPEGISLADTRPAADSAAVLEGLDDVSPEYQEWLERKRTELKRVKPPQVSALVDELGAVIQPPFLVLIEPQFGASARSVAQQLATRLHLGYREGSDLLQRSGRQPALHFVPPPYTDEIAAAILAADNTVFILEQPSTTQTSPALLLLRTRYPAERTRFVKLPPLSWAEARSYLNGLHFAEAASAYLTSTGNPVYLQELAAMRLQRPALPLQQLPRRIKAGVQLRTAQLSATALLALERCSVHPGVLPDQLLLALQAETSAEELERSGWLRFHPELWGWTLNSQLARQVIYEELQPGRRRHYHLLAASCFAEHDEHLSAMYHQLCAAGAAQVGSGAVPGLTGWTRPSLDAWLDKPGAVAPPRTKLLLAGQELDLLPASNYTNEDERPHVIVVERWPHSHEQKFSWELPDEPFLLRLRGRGLVNNALGVGLSGTAAPLELSWSRLQHRVVLGHALSATVSAPTELLLPLTDTFEYWYHLPAGGEMLISSQAETALIEFEVSAYRCSEPASGSEPDAVHAIMLDEHTRHVPHEDTLLPAL